MILPKPRNLSISVISLYLRRLPLQSCHFIIAISRFSHIPSISLDALQHMSLPFNTVKIQSIACSYVTKFSHLVCVQIIGHGHLSYLIAQASPPRLLGIRTQSPQVLIGMVLDLLAFQPLFPSLTENALLFCLWILTVTVPSKPP